MREEAGLKGTQYSTMASMNAIAQLVWLVSSAGHIGTAEQHMC